MELQVGDRVEILKGSATGEVGTISACNSRTAYILDSIAVNVPFFIVKSHVELNPYAFTTTIGAFSGKFLKRI